MLQNIPREKILEVVSLGPTFPAKIVKQVGGDTMIVGAILSTILTTGKIRVSTLKIGGSPLYYIPEHESKLEEYIDHLNEKDRRTFLLIKEHKVLKDDSQDALTRVSLKTIRDFAKPLYLEQSGIKVLFWRFYAIPIEQAELMAQSILEKLPKVQEVRQEIRSEIKFEVKPEIQLHENEIRKLEETKQKHELAENKIIIESKIIDEALSHAAHEEIHPNNNNNNNNIINHQEIPKELLQDSHQDTHKIHHVSHLKPVKHEVHHREQKDHKEEHTERVEKVHKEKLTKPLLDPNKKEFYELILNFITANGLDLLSKEKIKKTEYNLILKNHSTNEYIYCKAKDKTTLSDADLAPALIFAQNKKMPCLFLSTGNISPKTQVMMDKEFSGLMFKKI